MEDQHPGRDEDPGDHTADRAQSAADRLARPDKRSPSGRGEGLLNPLQLVLTEVAPEQQTMRVVPAPLVLPGLCSAPYGSLEQEVPEPSQRQGDDNG